MPPRRPQPVLFATRVLLGYLHWLLVLASPYIHASYAPQYIHTYLTYLNLYYMCVHIKNVHIYICKYTYIYIFVCV